MKQSLWEVNALKISATGTNFTWISANGTDLVGTYFQCHLHDTGFQCVLLGALIFSTLRFSGTAFQYVQRNHYPGYWVLRGFIHWYYGIAVTNTYMKYYWLLATGEDGCHCGATGCAWALGSLLTILVAVVEVVSHHAMLSLPSLLASSHHL